MSEKKSLLQWIELMLGYFGEEKTWERYKWKMKSIIQKQKTLVDKDLTTFCNVISIWNMYSCMYYTVHSNSTQIYELNELVMYRSNIKITKSIAIIRSSPFSLAFSSSLALLAFVSECLFFLLVCLSIEWCVKPSLFKYTIWKREHEALSHKTISGSRETSTIFKWFLLLQWLSYESVHIIVLYVCHMDLKLRLQIAIHDRQKSMRFPTIPSVLM